MARKRTIGVMAIVATAALVLGGGAIWEWGRSRNHWGTSDQMAALMALEIVHPRESGLRVVFRERSPYAPLLGKSIPQSVTYSVGAQEGSGITNTFEAVSAALQEAARAGGWTIDEACSPDFAWCASVVGQDGLTIMATVRPTDEADISTTESSLPVTLKMEHA